MFIQGFYARSNWLNSAVQVIFSPFIFVSQGRKRKEK